MDFRIDSADSVLYLCDTEVEEAREDSDIEVHKDECKMTKRAVEVLALFILFFYILQIGDNWRVLL